MDGTEPHRCRKRDTPLLGLGMQAFLCVCACMFVFCVPVWPIWVLLGTLHGRA